MSDDADRDVDDSAPGRRPKLPAALDRLFASVPSSSDLAARHADREQRLAEQGRRLDWAALEQMRDAVAEPVDCALDTLRPLTAELGAVPVPSDPDVWVELGRILDSATCTRDPRCDACDKRSEWGYW
jgi:hypothetical protein